jgi:hypothetical protein
MVRIAHERDEFWAFRNSVGLIVEGTIGFALAIDPPSPLAKNNDVPGHPLHSATLPRAGDILAKLI